MSPHSRGAAAQTGGGEVRKEAQSTACISATLPVTLGEPASPASPHHIAAGPGVKSSEVRAAWAWGGGGRIIHHVALPGCSKEGATELGWEQAARPLRRPALERQQLSPCTAWGSQRAAHTQLGRRQGCGLRARRTRAFSVPQCQRVRLSAQSFDGPSREAAATRGIDAAFTEQPSRVNPLRFRPNAFTG